MRHQRAMLPALLASIFLHVAVVAAARLTPEHASGGPVPPPDSEPVDLWAGETPALPGEAAALGGPGDVPHNVDARGSVAPNPPATATTAPIEAPRAAPRAPLPAPGRGHEAPATTPAVARASGIAARGRAQAKRGAQAQQAGGPAAAAGDDGADGAQGNFGAAGSTAVRSLGRAFTRAIPPACQADPAWASLPAGDAGKARFVIEIDDAGHIASWRPEGEAAPARHLGNLAKRTIALLGGGTFAVARGTVTAGRQTLEISAIVSDGAAEDDPGSGAELAFRFADGRGEAGFAQPGGRRVAITLRVVRTDVAATSPPG